MKGFAIIDHTFVMHPRANKGGSIVTSLAFPGYIDHVSTKLSDSHIGELSYDETTAIHADHVFVLLDRLAERHCRLGQMFQRHVEKESES